MSLNPDLMRIRIHKKTYEDIIFFFSVQPDVFRWVDPAGVYFYAAEVMNVVGEHYKFYSGFSSLIGQE
jgi:hypothetical protein